MNTTDNNPYDEGKVLLFNKPYGITSFALVKRVRYATGAKKVGHAGTLDPLASGLMILCTGKMTKQIHTFQAQEKEYTGTFVLGATRPSYDMETETDGEFDVSHITEKMILEAAKLFTGDIMQTPPVFSAVKINGKRAYDMARNKEEVSMTAKPVTISELEITRISMPDSPSASLWRPMEVDFRVVCSKGTYIRSLAHDIGKALGSGAYLSALCRTRIGEFRLEDALDADDFVNTLKPGRKNAYLQKDPEQLL